jgi:hypothetical protein
MEQKHRKKMLRFLPAAALRQRPNLVALVASILLVLGATRGKEYSNVVANIRKRVAADRPGKEE